MNVQDVASFSRSGRDEINRMEKNYIDRRVAFISHFFVIIFCWFNFFCNNAASEALFWRVSTGRVVEVFSFFSHFLLLSTRKKRPTHRFYFMSPMYISRELLGEPTKQQVGREGEFSGKGKQLSHFPRVAWRRNKKIPTRKEKRRPFSLWYFIPCLVRLDPHVWNANAVVSLSLSF